MQKTPNTSSDRRFSIDRELALKKFFETSPMMMGIADVEGDDIRHISDNDAAATFFGMPTVMMEGKLSSELGTTKENRIFWINHYKKAEAENRAITFNYSHQLDTEQKFFSVTVSFMGKTDAGHSRFSYVVQDMTALEKANTELEKRIKERTRELEIQKTKLECLMKSAPIGVAFLDRDMKYEYINPVLAEMNGKTPEQHLGKTVQEILPSNYHLLLPTLKKVMDEGIKVSNWEYEASTEADNKKPHTFLANYFPVIIDKKIIGVGAAVVDLTFKKEAENQLKSNELRYRTVVEGIKDYAIIRMDREGNVVDWNRGAEEILGYTREEILGVQGKIIFTKEDLDKGAAEKEMEIALKTGKAEDKRWHVKKNGALFFANGVMNSLRDESNRLIGFVKVLRDETERKTHEDDQKNLVQELERERDLREQFVITLSHDLRTPLTAAKIGAQIISRKSSDVDAVNRSANRIVDNMNRADTMIRDLLDTNRLKAGEKISLDIGHCHLNKIVQDALEELSTVHGDRFQFEASENFEGQWSCSGLRRIVENLCNNAIKYGSPHSPVSVRLAGDENWICMKVHNEGNPISPADQAKLFDPFNRSKSAQESTHRGWGLGLTLVKGLTEAHGGRVEVVSSPEKGTTFTVNLPRKS